jgi:flagellin
MRELAVQAGNGTLNQSNRDNIQTELNQLTEQLGDIGKNTKFNGISVFQNNKSLNIQVGFNQQVSLKLGDLSTSSLSGGPISANGDLNSGRVDAATAGVSAGNVSINGVELGALAASTSGQADIKADIINQVSGQTGVTATASNVIEGGVANPNQPVTQGISVTIDGNTATLGSSANLDSFIKDFNLNVAGAEASIDSEGAIQIFNNTGKDITLGDNTVGGLGSLGLTAGTFSGSISLSSSTNEEITVSTANAGNIDDLKSFGFNQQQGASSLTGGQISGQNITEADGIEINGVKLGSVGFSGSNVNANDVSQAINSITSQTGVTASAQTSSAFSADIPALQSNTLTINGNDVFSGFNGTSLDDVINEVNSANIGDIRASSNSDGELVLSSDSGQTINIQNGASAFKQDNLAINNTFAEQGKLSLDANDGAPITISSSAPINSQTSALDKLGLSDVGSSANSSLGNVFSVENSSNLISNIDNIIGQIGKTRSSLGATQSRFLSTINNLSDTLIQSESARSRIEDTDYAKSISEFLKARFAEQASTITLVKSRESERALIGHLLGS